MTVNEQHVAVGTVITHSLNGLHEKEIYQKIYH